MSTTDSLLQSALDEAMRAGADYAEARHEGSHREGIHVRNGAVERLATDRDAGWGIHALAGGGWGFASTSSEAQDAVRDTASRAVDIARASGTRRHSRSDLSVMPTAPGQYATPMHRAPVTVPLTERIQLILHAS